MKQIHRNIKGKAFDFLNIDIGFVVLPERNAAANHRNDYWKNWKKQSHTSMTVQYLASALAILVEFGNCRLTN